MKKIEKLLQKVVKRASNNTAEKVCKDTVFDALRYSLLVKYQYKKRILGKSATFFHSLFFALSAFSVPKVSTKIETGYGTPIA